MTENKNPLRDKFLDKKGNGSNMKVAEKDTKSIVEIVVSIFFRGIGLVIAFLAYLIIEDILNLPKLSLLQFVATVYILYYLGGLLTRKSKLDDVF